MAGWQDGGGIAKALVSCSRETVKPVEDLENTAWTPVLEGGLSTLALRPLSAKPRRPQPAQAQECEQQNYSLRNGAVEAPNRQHILFDVAEIEREAEAGDGGNGEQGATLEQREPRQHQVTGNAHGRHGNVRNL